MLGHFFYLLEYVTRVATGKKIKVKIEPEPKLLPFYKCYLHQTHLNQAGGEFQPKHQLIYKYYHSNGFHLTFSCEQQVRQSFCSISLNFPIILSFFFFFDFRIM